MTKTLWLIAAVGLALGCTRVPPPQEEHHKVIASDLLTRVANVLADHHQSGSLVYRGECTDDGGITDSFRVGAQERRVSAIQALRDAFANEARLTAAADASGRIRVLGGDVQTDLLELRIPKIVFHAEADPRDATVKLLNLTEVSAYMNSHHISFVSAMGGIAPMPKGAHLTVTMKDATIAQALDRIGQTFPGLWIYGECATAQGLRLVDFTFIEF